MKLNRAAMANAAGTTVAVVYTVCRLFVWMFPDLSFTIMRAWFHGLAVQPMSAWSLSFSAFLLGLVGASVSAWLVGWCLAHCYNMFANKK